jgi:AcrR family transcriptional regulator
MKVTGKTRILQSAAYILRTKGYNATRLSDIAERAGMLAPSIYHHFKSKDAIVEQVMLDGIYINTHRIMARVEVLGPDHAPVERLRAAIVAHVEFLLSDDDFSSAVARVFEELPEDMRQRVLAAYASFDNYWRDLILAAAPPKGKINATLARKYLIAMLGSTPAWYRTGRLSPEQIAQQAADLFLNGFVGNGGAA